MEGVCFIRLRIIETGKGVVKHALKSTEPAFRGFGEVYFSMIDKGAIKGWKLHSKMHLNLVVPVGDVRFYFLDADCVRFVDVGSKNHGRLTVSPGVWMAFEGLADVNAVMNLASIEHDPSEQKSRPINHLQLEHSKPL